MPFILVTDWLLMVVDCYDIALVTHSLVLPWSMILTVIGLRQLLNVKHATAWDLILLSTLTTLPFLALFAR
jgi:hypothetical protein